MSRTQRPPSAEVEAIGGRIIDILTTDFDLTMSQAANLLGYGNATTLHKVRKGLALPDPARLAKFAADQTILQHRTVNLHWIWTGLGPRLLDRTEVRHRAASSDEDDIIDIVRGMKPAVKSALRVLIAKHRRNS